MPDSNTSSEQWSAQTKLTIVAETDSMTESELSQYCREKVFFQNKSKAGAANVCKGLSE
ncbi:hypothetical protein [Vibrio splendidus]|uniref:hypothetical protein n=1 Tax=Vibrio splendidus TaxID=29497 RepID=UPI0002EBACE8|nr:hypothetical protein [Vibrio splendidus]UWZ96518.1 hypothetical protein IM698_08750 [Vibrio splendidus]